MTRLLHALSWHHLTHRHVAYCRDEADGIVVACSVRLPRAPVTLWWTPWPGHEPVEIPLDRLDWWMCAPNYAERIGVIR